MLYFVAQETVEGGLRSFGETVELEPAAAPGYAASLEVQHGGIYVLIANGPVRDVIRADYTALPAPAPDPAPVEPASAA